MRTNLSLIVLAGAALLLAGCGGASPSPGVAHLSSRTSASSAASGGGSSSSSESGGPTQQQMIAFSQCMRSHAVPEFPEPTEGHLPLRVGGNGKVAGVNPGSAEFQAARRVCRKLLPNGGTPSPAQQAKIQERALKFSRCMRAHGVPDFPDPTFSSGTVQLKNAGAPGGIDPNAPHFQAARKTCQSVLPKLPGAKGGPAEGGIVSGGGPKGGSRE